jgi:hypothetical protein
MGHAMSSDYSKSSLLKFLDTSVAKGMVNANTGAGLKAACVKILDDVADDADVRGIEVNTAVIRYNNRNPDVLAPNSLAQYQRRVSRAISDFVRWVENPAAFKMRSRGTPERNGKTGGKAPGKHAAVRAQDAPPAQGIPAITTSAGLPMSFPLRPDFLAQVVIPRDLTADEARRLGAFLLTLAADFRPPGSGEMK